MHPLIRLFVLLLVLGTSHAQNLLPNANFELPSAPSWPPSWGTVSSPNIFLASEGTNHFLRLVQTTPGHLTHFTATFPLPQNARALRLTWLERLNHFTPGEKPWFDAQLIFHLLDASGHEIALPPQNPEHTDHNVSAWRQRTRTFLLPEGTRSLSIQPALFQAQSGTYDLDDFLLEMIDPAPLIAAQQAALRHTTEAIVPWENPRTNAFPSPLHVEGPRLLNANNSEIWLQGVGSCGLESLPNDPHIHRTILVAIEHWNINCFRLPVREDYWFGRSPHQNDHGHQYRRAVDLAVNLCANRGIYLVLDLAHYHAPTIDHQRFWQQAAQRYANHPAVLFDLFNEPHDISWEIWRNGGPVPIISQNSPPQEAIYETKKSSFQSIGMQALLDTIRNTGARNIVIASGNHWANDLSGILDGFALHDPSGNGILYGWHTYHWHKGWAHILPITQKYPVFLAETGASPREEFDFIPLEWKEDPATFVPDLLGFIQKYRIHWAAWSLHPSASPRMIQSWDYDPTPYWGSPAFDALHGKHFPLTHMR